VEQIADIEKGEVTGITIRSLTTGERAELPVDGVFVAIGHTPNTGLFANQLEMNPSGYILTHAGTRTSVPGVFAAGDVRHGSVKRCASAVGEGAMAVAFVHRYLERL